MSGAHARIRRWSLPSRRPVGFFVKKNGRFTWHRIRQRITGEWLKTRIHHEGRRYLPHRLVEVVTGAPPSPDALVSHLETPYGAVYAL